MSPERVTGTTTAPPVKWVRVCVLGYEDVAWAAGRAHLRCSRGALENSEGNSGGLSAFMRRKRPPIDGRSLDFLPENEAGAFHGDVTLGGLFRTGHSRPAMFLDVLRTIPRICLFKLGT